MTENSDLKLHLFEEYFSFISCSPSLAPCVAKNVAAHLDCHNNTAEVSWSSAAGASSYKVTAISADGFQSSCETDGNQCAVTQLQCGQKYNVTLTSINNLCQIDTQTNVSFNSRKSRKKKYFV